MATSPSSVADRYMAAAYPDKRTAFPPEMPYNFHLIAKGYQEGSQNPKLDDPFVVVSLIKLLTMLAPQVEYYSDQANGMALEQVANRIPLTRR